MKKIKEQALDSGKTELDESVLKLLLKDYDEILDYTDMEFPAPKKVKGKGRGRNAKGKTRSLIERLRKLKDAVCRFVKDFTVPLIITWQRETCAISKLKLRFQDVSEPLMEQKIT